MLPVLPFSAKDSAWYDCIGLLLYPSGRLSLAIYITLTMRAFVECGRTYSGSLVVPTRALICSPILKVLREDRGSGTARDDWLVIQHPTIGITCWMARVNTISARWIASGGGEVQRELASKVLLDRFVHLPFVCPCATAQVRSRVLSLTGVQRHEVCGLRARSGYTSR